MQIVYLLNKICFFLLIHFNALSYRHRKAMITVDTRYVHVQGRKSRI